MGILGKVGISIGILIECSILVVPTVYLADTIYNWHREIEAAYSASYQEDYNQAYHARYQEGYSEQYEIGYKAQYNVGYNEAFDKGHDQGRETGLVGGREEGLAARVGLHDPTYEELEEFLAYDKTNLKSYIEDEDKYACFNFAGEVNNNAELEGIRAALVLIYFRNYVGHAIVAFQTVDKGLIFVEPQSDEIVKLVVGESYQPLVDEQVGDDDGSVVEVRIIW